MAAGWIPAPVADTSRPGPCAPDCHTWTTTWRPDRLIVEGETHTDCASLRAMATFPCRFCKQPIGYDTRYYVDPNDDKNLVHARCLEETERR